MPDRALAVEGDVGRPPADVDEQDAELFFLGQQDRFSGGERLEHDVLHGEARAVDRADHVLHRGHGAGHDVGLDLQAHAGHPDRLAHAVLVVHHERLGEHVDDLAVLGQVDRARGLDRPRHVVRAHLALLAGDRDHAAAVHAADVPARDPRVHGGHFHPGRLLGLADGLLDGLHGGVDVHHDATAQPARGGGPHGEDLEPARRAGLGDDRADLGGAHVQSRDEIFRSCACHPRPPLVSTTWSRNRKSIARTGSPSRPTCRRMRSSRASRSSHSSVPRRTSTASAV